MTPKRATPIRIACAIPALIIPLVLLVLPSLGAAYQPAFSQPVFGCAMTTCATDSTQTAAKLAKQNDDPAPSKADQNGVASHSELMDAVDSLDKVLKNGTEVVLDDDAVDTVRDSDPRRDRLVTVGFFGGMLLAILGVLFGYLRLNHASRGFHSGRLQMVALGVVVLLGLIGYLLWTQFLF